MATKKKATAKPVAKKSNTFRWVTAGIGILYAILLIFFVYGAKDHPEERKIVIAWGTFLAMVAALGTITVMKGATKTGKLTENEFLITLITFLIPGIALFTCAMRGETALKTALVVLQYIVLGLLGIGLVATFFRFIDDHKNRKKGDPEPAAGASWILLGLLLFYSAIVFMCDPFAVREPKDTGADRPFAREEKPASEKKSDPTPTVTRTTKTTVTVVTTPTPPKVVQMTEELGIDRPTTTTASTEGGHIPE